MERILLDIDTVLCSPSICVRDLEKSQNIIFSPWGRIRVVNGLGRAGSTHFYLAQGHNGLGIMGY